MSGFYLPWNDHDCDEAMVVAESDLCSKCGEHAVYCSICETSNCCYAKPIQVDEGDSHE